MIMVTVKPSDSLYKISSAFRQALCGHAIAEAVVSVMLQTGRETVPMRVLSGLR
jgi:hypothetical protein